jgi:hypothetical protein
MTIMNARVRLVVSMAILLTASPGTPTALAASPPHSPTVQELLRRTDDLLRSSSSRGTLTMRIASERWQRELRMSFQSEGTDKTLIQILAPPKEKGTATLKVGSNIWHYLPKVDRTIKVPASMMSASWMGSHFTNDDLVKESRFENDYDCEFEHLPGDDDDHYLIGCMPKPDAPVVWGSVEVQIRARDELPDEVRFFDERGELMRSLLYDDVGDLGGRLLPRRLRVVPADTPEEFTEVRYDQMEFDVEIPERTFSLQALRR